MNASRLKKRSVLLALGWYVHEINVGVAKYAAEADWILDDAASHVRGIPRGWEGDGILTILQETRSSLARYILRANLPTVNLTTNCSEIPFPRVIPDNHAIGRIAAEEFLSRGFEHLGFLCYAPFTLVVEERLQGFKSCVEKAGKKFYRINLSSLSSKNNNLPKMISALGLALSKLPKPLGVAAQYDADANLVSRAALAMNLKVPEEVAIIGADNDPIYSRFGPIPLSSVDTNLENLGYQGAALLDRLMSGQKPPRNAIRVPVRGIILRESSDLLATTDPAIYKAMKAIQASLTKQITIDEIVRASGVSRRSLFLKFKKGPGRSPKQEIIRQRIQLAQKKLATENKKIETIAAECGFQSTDAFVKAFRREIGQSPSTFRTPA